MDSKFDFSVLHKKNFYDFIRDLKCNIYPVEFYESKEFISRICSIKSVMKFRLVMFALEDIISFLDIYEDRYRLYIAHSLNSNGLNNMYKSIIDDVGKIPNPTFICDKYADLFDGPMYSAFVDKVHFGENKEELTRFLAMYFNRLACDMISEYLFKDLFNNVLIDCEQLLQYNSKVNLVLRDHIAFYNKFMSLDDMKFSEKLNFFNKYKDTNIVGMFYDDMSILKNHAKRDVSSSCIKLDDSLISPSLSRKFGVKVYKYDGAPFRGVFRLANAYREYYNDSRFPNMMCESDYAYSFSFSDSEHFWLYGNPEDKYAFFYDNLGADEIVHMSTTDSFSEARDHVLYVSKYPNELVSSRELIGGTHGYNEIVLLGNGGKRPSAIVLMDTSKKEKSYESIIKKSGGIDTFHAVSAKRSLETLIKARENTIKFAKEFNIPIMYINAEKYNTTYSGVIENYPECNGGRYGNYITDYSELRVYNNLGRRK